QARLFAIEFALAELLLSRGTVPACVCGHSLGELVAATVAGVFELNEALDLIVARGRLVRERVSSGVMLSVSLDVEAIEPLLLDNRIQVAAINSASQTVVAGDATAIAALETRLSAEGIHSRRLHTN